MLLNCGVGEDSWESLGLQGDPTSPSKRRSVLGVHWKDWCRSWNSNTLATSCEELTRWKDPDAGRGWGQVEKEMAEDEMAGWHHWLDGHEFEWDLGVGDGQGGLACYDSWGCKELDTTEWLNWIELKHNYNNGNNYLKIVSLKYPQKGYLLYFQSEAFPSKSLCLWNISLIFWSYLTDNNGY